METPAEILEKGVARGLHPGAQLYVARDGQQILDFACGEARPGAAMRSDSIVQWYSSGKPLTAVFIAMLHERGAIEIERPVRSVIPEFAHHGKEAVTFKHLLTHSAGFRSADKIPPATAWPEMIRQICEAPAERDWAPGSKGGYSTQASWFILAEAIQRILKKPFDEAIKAELLDPLGLANTWLRLPFAKSREHGERLAWMHDTSAGRREPLPLQDPEGMAICRPGASARGPVRELGRFMQMLLDGGELDGRRVLHPATIAWMTERHREGLFDRTFMHKLDFGLGFIINSARYGADTAPYGYGSHASDAAFGHSGAQSSCAFADPEHGLVVAWAANGQPGEKEHQDRQRAVNTAVYEWLGLRRGKSI
jgi:CubicO group peptidase (beta-lactamase class C family)